LERGNGHLMAGIHTVGVEFEGLGKSLAEGVEGLHDARVEKLVPL